MSFKLNNEEAMQALQDKVRSWQNQKIKTDTDNDDDASKSNEQEDNDVEKQKMAKEFNDMISNMAQKG